MSGDGTSLLTLIAGALVCSAPFDCNLDFDKYGGIILWLAIMLYMFKALGAICDEYFVPSLEVIVEKLQLSNDVAGATFMAAGSSAPELFTSLVATFLIVNEGGVGTIVGSAIFNILIIVGVTCYVACKDQDLPIWWYPLSRDAFFYVLSIVELMVILSDEQVMWYEGVIMIFSYILYCVYMKFNPAIIDLIGLERPSKEELVEEVEEETKPESQAVDIKGCGVNGLRVGAQPEAPPGPPEHHLGSTTQDLQPETIGSKDCEPGVVDGQATEADAMDKPQKPPPLVEKPPPPVGHLALIEDHRGPQQDKVTAPADHIVWSLHEQRISQSGHTPRGSPRDGNHKASAPDTPADDAAAAFAPAGSQPGKVTWGHKRTSQHLDVLMNGDGSPAADVAEEAEEEEKKGMCSWCKDPLLWFWEVTMPYPENHYWILFTLSIIYIGCCTYVMVDATNRVGVILHIPALAMALVFLAAGTSIPDALGSVAVAKQGEGDMAVANALGSNVFDILVGLGVPWTIKCAMGEKVEFKDKWRELQWDIVILCAVLVLFIGALVINRWRLTRSIGIVLLVFYLFFLVYALPLSVWVLELKKIDST